MKEEYNLPDNSNADSKLELIKHSTQVHSRLKEDITSDFVLAKISDPNIKEAMVELTSNAYFCKKLILEIQNKTTWHWNNQTKQWENQELQDNQINRIKTLAEQTFDSFMKRLTMTAVLARNVPENHLIKLVAGVKDEPEPDEETDDKSLTKIRNLLKKEGD